jgi:hypothetical protein
VVMRHREQNGFAVLHILIVLIILIAIAGIGWFVFKKSSSTDATNKNTSSDTSSDKTASSPDPDPPEQAATLKEYKNTDYGFLFKYPDTWNLKETRQDIGGGLVAGEVTATATSGTVVKFRFNQGGKGGGCESHPEDVPHDTKNCPTNDILEQEKLPTTTRSGYPVYLYMIRYTPSTDTETDPQSIYTAYLEGQDRTPRPLGPAIDALHTFGIIEGDGRTDYIESSMTVDDQTKETFFQSKQFAEAREVLRTFRLF